MKYRTLLFIPGNNPGMLTGLEILGADAYIVDLEDAVSLDNKDSARELVKEYLNNFKGTSENSSYDIFVRINPPETDYFDEDLKALIGCDIRGFVLPKASVESVKALHEHLKGTDYKIIALIETAASLETAYQTLGSSPLVEGVLLGAEDMTLDLGAKRTKASREIEYARGKVVAAAKANGVQAIDTPWTDTDDLDGLRADSNYAKAIGMTGKALISPRHVDIVNEVFSPSKEDIRYAIRVFEALKEAKAEGKGAFSLDGKMIDRPIILRATDTLKSSGYFTEEYDALIG